MKINKLLVLCMMSIFISFSSCSTDDSDEPIDPTDDITGEPGPQPADPSPLNLSAYNNGSRVMMQAFYWDVEPRHEWWDNLSEKVPGWADAGINRLWLLPKGSLEAILWDMTFPTIMILVNTSNMER
jgi:alpha-amylase